MPRIVMINNYKAPLRSQKDKEGNDNCLSIICLYLVVGANTEHELHNMPRNNSFGGFLLLFKRKRSESEFAPHCGSLIIHMDSAVYQRV